MTTITIDEAQARLSELIDQLKPGEEVVITRDSKPVAKLTGEVKAERPAPKLGTLKGTVLYMAPDFIAPLEEFKDYT